MPILQGLNDEELTLAKAIDHATKSNTGCETVFMTPGHSDSRSRMENSPPPLLNDGRIFVIE